MRLAIMIALALSVLVGHAVQDEGTARPVRPGGANFIGAGISCVDGTTRTDCTLVAPALLNKSTTSTETCSSSSIFDLYRFTVPANTLGTTGTLRLRIFGDVLQNDAATSSWTYTIVFGATTVHQSATALLGADPDRGALYIDLQLSNTGATNAQAMTMLLRTSQKPTASSGIGQLGGGATVLALNGGIAGGTSAVDTTADADIAVRVTHSLSSASTCTRRQQATLELI